MKNPVIGNCRHQQRDRNRLNQFSLRIRCPCLGRQFLLHQTLPVKALEHGVETGNQVPDLVFALPVGPECVVIVRLHAVGDSRQTSQRLGNLPRNIENHQQDQPEQARRHSEVQPHPLEQDLYSLGKELIKPERGSAPRTIKGAQCLAPLP